MNTNNEQIEKEYMETIPFTIDWKKYQIPMNKPNKGCEWPLQGELQTSEERDQGRLQKVEWSPVFMNWQNQHSKNGYITKSNLHMQCNFHQNPCDIHHRDQKIYTTVHLESQETMNSQGNTQ
jgi:hypothetical protein